MADSKLRVVLQNPNGRIVVSDSATYSDDTLTADDVLVAGSYCGRTSAVFALRRGVKALIEHAAGVGKDRAGISALDYAQGHRVPAAAVESASARIADGASLYAGRIGFANALAAALGVKVGQPVAEAAALLLQAPPGRCIDVSDALTSQLVAVERGATGAIYTILSLSLVPEPHPRDVFCVGSHTGAVLVHYGMKVRPMGIIANDAGDAAEHSGIAGLEPLAAGGVAAAAVSAASACIGDETSTWREGIISACNRLAESRGVRPGMTAQQAARALLTAPVLSAPDGRAG